MTDSIAAIKIVRTSVIESIICRPRFENNGRFSACFGNFRTNVLNLFVFLFVILCCARRLVGSLKVCTIFQTELITKCDPIHIVVL